MRTTAPRALLAPLPASLPLLHTHAHTATMARTVRDGRNACFEAIASAGHQILLPNTLCNQGRVGSQMMEPEPGGCAGGKEDRIAGTCSPSHLTMNVAGKHSCSGREAEGGQGEDPCGESAERAAGRSREDTFARDTTLRPSRSSAARRLQRRAALRLPAHCFGAAPCDWPGDTSALRSPQQRNNGGGK